MGGVTTPNATAYSIFMKTIPIRYRLRPPQWDDWGGNFKTVALQARYAASPPTKRMNGTFLLEIYETVNNRNPLTVQR